jgi:CDP-diglyceride synthetase
MLVALRNTHTATSVTVEGIVVVLASLIVLGLWAPVIGALIASMEIWVAFAYQGGFWTAILLVTLASTLALIGPGAFSIDARLFGRKHIRN